MAKKVVVGLGAALGISLVLSNVYMRLMDGSTREAVIYLSLVIVVLAGITALIRFGPGSGSREREGSPATVEWGRRIMGSVDERRSPWGRLALVGPVFFAVAYAGIVTFNLVATDLTLVQSLIAPAMLLVVALVWAGVVTYLRTKD